MHWKEINWIGKIKFMAGGKPGNKNGVKLKSPDIRAEAYRQYCEHIAGGRSQKSWCFEHPELTCTYKTMNKYIEEDPIAFPPIQRQLAEIKGYYHWEQVVADSAKGINKEANTASLQMLMRNKFDWDKQDMNEVVECAADKVLDAIRKTIS